MPMDADAARAKAQALVAQATDDSVTEEEARSHALAAARLIARFELLDVEPDPLSSMAGAVMSPEVGEALGSIVDLVGRVKKSGIIDAAKKAVGASRRAAASTRTSSGGSRRRHRR
jgi:hypothetical protein